MSELQHTNVIYHYTKYRALIKIIKSGKFKTSLFSKANDYKEKYSNLERREQIDSYRYISFSDNGSIDYHSFANPVLWHYYANKGKGVCIGVDLKALLSLAAPITNGAVSYKNGVSRIDNQDIEEYLMEKRKDWNGESEYRILYLSEQSEISNFVSCIRSIFLGDEVTDKQVARLKNLLPNNIKLYRMYIDKNDGRYNKIEI